MNILNEAPGGYIINEKKVFFENEVFEKTVVFFFYSRISTKNAVFLNFLKNE